MIKTPATHYPNHPYAARSSNSSASSMSESGSRRSDRRDGRSGSGHVESTVTKLLVAIKHLLEALSQWSHGQINEEQVSDAYVQLGNNFNATVSAFSEFHIDMSELLSVPEDLREVLEQCLSEEEATEATLEIYLPKVQQIMARLWQGIPQKQEIHRRMIEFKRAGSSHRGNPMRSSSNRTSDAESVRTQSSRRKTSESSDRWAGGFSDAPSTQQEPERSMTPSRTSHSLSRRQYMTSSSQNFVPGLPPRPAPPENEEPLPPVPPPPMPTTTPVPASVKRYSLTDAPISAPTLVIQDASPSIPEEQPPDRTPARPPSPPIGASRSADVENSLAALKKGDALERRASKRFSTYTIQRMTGSREKSSQRRSAVANGVLTSNDLDVLAEVDESTPPSKSRSRRELTRQKSTDSIGGSRRARPPPIDENEVPPPVPPIPPIPSTQILPASPGKDGPSIPPADPDNAKTPEPTVTSKPPAEASQPEPQSPVSRTISVFMQVGSQVKKVSIEPGLSFAALRVIFVDKFSYSPGQDNFPAIYIRDTSSGVQYELEDVDEVKAGCLLSLNIEPLDQVKQHIDNQMTSLSREIKDLRATVAAARQTSQHPVTQPAPVAAASPSMISLPSEKQFQVAQKLSNVKSEDEGASPLVPQITGSSRSDSRIVTDLKTQFEGVQDLRRDLAVMRQVYGDFVAQTKAALGSLRTQTRNVRQVATTKVGGARAFIDTGKAKLDSRSQDVLTKIEELQDMVENLKDDVIKRQVTPKLSLMNSLKVDIEASAKELDSLAEVVKTVKPMWKKTWEEELQNIVEEQQFLGHQEELLTDLRDDFNALSEVYGHVEKVITIRGNTRPSLRSRSFRPPPPEEGHNGLSTVMLEIKGAAVDTERRMKAIAASQKAREKEKASRADEFEKELREGGKKLKKTGGAEEAERLRQVKNDQALRTMFSGASTPIPTTPSNAGDPPSPPSNPEETPQI